MPNYIRAFVPGGTFFFTLNLLERRRRLLTNHSDDLRIVFADARRRRPFTIDAIFVLPDHLHSVWTLPVGDGDFSTRWHDIKAWFSARIPKHERLSSCRARKGERGIWQRRFWEHRIRDEDDLRRHIDYVHYNPIKHGHVSRLVDWPYSSFHRYVKAELYPPHWAADDVVKELALE
ncbi:REP-associated tyrosine transposase [Candidatus Thiosymbion oneisti]|uniref:REP-associated tyrosine transposase n=1 Tax=Candidatus Thiosymbion oneisti TaxID=589554 RepID=UPI00105D0C0F